MSAQPTGEPIMIRCEGSGCPGNLPGDDTALCTMCGALVAADDDDRIVEHERDDIIARLKRGDFG